MSSGWVTHIKVCREVHKLRWISLDGEVSKFEVPSPTGGKMTRDEHVSATTTTDALVCVECGMLFSPEIVKKHLDSKYGT